MSPDRPDPRWLEAALAELAESEAAVQAPPRVEQALRAAFRAQAARPAGRSRRAWWLAAAAAALAAWSATPRRAPDADDSASAAVADSQGFVWLVEGEPLAELDAVQVVRVRVPGPALARLGGPLGVDAADSLDAQVLVGEDGIARAIRFVE